MEMSSRRSMEAGMFSAEVGALLEAAAPGAWRAFRLQNPRDEEDEAEPGGPDHMEAVGALLYEAAAWPLVEDLRPRLAPFGCVPLVVATSRMDAARFLGDASLVDQEGPDHLLGVVRASDPLEVVRLVATNGTNYDVMPEDVVRKFVEWRQGCRYQIVGAGFDWASLRFETLPENLSAFAEEIYDFCPDVLDQGIVVPLADDMDIEDIEEAFDEQTTDDLARYLEREKRLFLWWD